MIKYDVSDLNCAAVTTCLTYLKRHTHILLCIPDLDVIGIIRDEDKKEFEKAFSEVFQQGFNTKLVFGKNNKITTDVIYRALKEVGEDGKKEAKSGRKANSNPNKEKKPRVSRSPRKVEKQS